MTRLALPLAFVAVVSGVLFWYGENQPRGPGQSSVPPELAPSQVTAEPTTIGSASGGAPFSLASWPSVICQGAAMPPDGTWRHAVIVLPNPIWSTGE